MRRPTWQQLGLRWSSPAGEQLPDAQDAAILELFDGTTTLAIRSATRGMEPGWVPFSLRHAHPELADDSDAGFLLVVRATAEPGEREDFRRWLDEEHAPRQTAIAGVHWYLGFEQDGADHSFLNLWGIDDPAIATSDEWVAVRESPWWDRVAHIPAAGDRGVYRVIRAPAED